ncbi:MAG: RagB/SusD family nutrient uptake outer membrane protein [Bacteroidota bacterium]
MRNYIVLLFALALIFSCTDLEEELLDSTTGEELFVQLAVQFEEDPEAAALSVVGPVYGQLTAFLAQDGIYALQEHPSDEMLGPTRGTDWDDGGVWRVLHTHDWDPNHRMVTAAWDGMNVGVARAFFALETFDLSGVTESLPAFVAEAKFMRAYYMFHLIDMFGQVPYQDEAGNAIVVEREEATALAIQDLREAIPALPLKADQEYGRATQGAAKTMLAKYLLNLEVFTGTAATNAQLQEVITLADEVTASGQYAIAEDYFGMFNTDNSANWTSTDEAMIVVENNEDINRGPSHSRVMMTTHYNQKYDIDIIADDPGSPWNGFATVADFYNRWDADGNPGNGVETNDIRFSDESYVDQIGTNRGFLVGQQFDLSGTALEDRNGNPLIYTPEVSLTSAAEPEGVRVLKYSPDQDTPTNDQSDTDFVLLRYSDLVLMKAEAQWRLGQSAEAAATINTIRTVRGVPEITTVSGDGQEVLNERGFELYWEGHRRNDVIRFGTFNDAYSERSASDPFTRLFPIPQGALDTNPNLRQNDGY